MGSSRNQDLAITTVKPGDFVIAPFHGCGECDACRSDSMGHVIDTLEVQTGQMVFNQNIFVSTIKLGINKIPGLSLDYTEGMLKSYLWQMLCLQVTMLRDAPMYKEENKVVVIGDGAVGQCAVIAAKMRGASQLF